ncbi:MAG TPA: helix-turn-helix domain-containing protein [Candidatus Cloacimonadota bacterium]|nr:helix-turn-helix domain-containing protein [Candidatus Cloacimonadota bacterium]
MRSFVDKLISIGLTENEAKVYCCLLRKHQFTATEIAYCAGVNRSKIYSVLTALAQKGLCIEKLGKVRKFEAIEPGIAFQKMIEEEKNKLEMITGLPDLLSPIYDSNKKKSSPLDFIQVFSTPASIIKKHHNLELAARKFVLSFCKEPYAMTKSVDIHEEQQASMNKGVIFKSIYEVEADNLEFFAQQMKNFEDNGEEIRVLYHLPIKLHIFDDHTSMFSMTNQINPEENLTYLVIEHPDLAETLIETFYHFWDKSLSVTEFLNKEKIELK